MNRLANIHMKQVFPMNLISTISDNFSELYDHEEAAYSEIPTKWEVCVLYTAIAKSGKLWQEIISQSCMQVQSLLIFHEPDSLILL